MTPNHIHLIRHAQGYHNLSIESHSIRDPLLTPEGEQQCIELSKTISNIQSIDCIFSSPLRRALYTALVTFRDVLRAKPGLKVIALAELQETSTLPCDVGLSLHDLRPEFEALPVDFSLVPEYWNNKDSGPFAPRTDLVSSRARSVRQLLRLRRENEIAVVTHGGLLHFLTEDWAGSMTGCGTGWRNCELRTYTFCQDPNKSSAGAALVETASSLARRINIPQSLKPDEQLQQQLVTLQAWATEGYVVLAGATIAESANHTGDETGGSTAHLEAAGLILGKNLRSVL